MIPSPPGRLVCSVILVIALIAAASHRVLITAAVIAGALAIIFPRSRRAHFKFLIWIWFPFAIWITVVWGWIVAAPPGMPPNSDAAGGILYAAQISFRMEAIVAIMQTSLLSLPPDQLGAALLSLHVPRGIVLVILNVFALGPELRKRADQVLTARIARGLLQRRSRLGAAQNLASTLMPLVAWGFRSSAARADHWLHRRLLDSPALNRAASFSFCDSVYIALSTVFCMLTLSNVAKTVQ